MKIYDSNLTGTSAAETSRTQQGQQSSRTGSNKGTAVNKSDDRVEFSGTLSRLSGVLSTFESSRSSRVAALVAQYQSGKYQPNPAGASKGIVAEDLSAGLE